MRAGIFAAAVLALFTQRALAEEIFVAAPQTVADEKAVFATVESANVIPARARIGGTVVQLAVQRGDRVEQGQVLATVADEKLALQIKNFSMRRFPASRLSLLKRSLISTGRRSCLRAARPQKLALIRHKPLLMSLPTR